MLCSLVLVSSIRCFLIYDACFPFERDNLIVAYLPHFMVTIPFPTRLLHLFPQLLLDKANAHPYNDICCKGRWRRFPLTFCDNQLHGLEALLPLRIITIAHTHETVTILREQQLRAFPTWFEMQKRSHNTASLSHFPELLKRRGAVGFFVPLLLFRLPLSASGGKDR